MVGSGRHFCDTAAGVSPKALARQLNAEHCPGLGGKPWNPSTIHGNPTRGTGILNNELYIGRLVWNRLRYVRDPDTGKRVSRLNPSSEWITTDVPHLRVVPDEPWSAAKERQTHTRRAIAATGKLGTANRPRYLFSELTKCGVYGADFIVGAANRLHPSKLPLPPDLR
jgi:hypothetical protein